MTNRIVVAVALIASLAAACRSATQPESQQASAPAFDTWSETLAQDWVRIAPQMATRAQYFSGAEQDALDRQLAPMGEFGSTFGPAAAAERAAIAQRGLDQLATLATDSLTPQQRTSAALLRWSLEDARGFSDFSRHSYVFDQFNGLQLELINHLTQTHPIRNRRDVENYLARLALVAPTLDKGIEEARAGVAAGIVAPRFILQRTIDQIDGFLSNTPRANVYVSTLDTRMGALGEALPPADREMLLAEAESTTAGSVIPAYRRIRDFLAEQLPKSTDDAGVWRLPRGDEWYAFSLKRFTTTNLSADEIHNIGLREVARIEGEMDTILRQLGYTSGSVNQRYAQLEAAIQPKGAADPRPQILADAEKWVRDAERRSAALFDLRPKAAVEVRREPAFSEKTAAAHYTDPAPDGSRPGVYYLPLPGAPYQLVRQRSLAYHEAVPGHHFQIALQQEAADLPRFRRLGIFGAGSAFIEGWALYAERLADENGWYEGDPQGRLGYLNMQLLRARRLVVDTGIHAKRWTRQQAIDYGINAQEIERYIVWPGQACAYMIGQLRIIDFREKARMAMGDRFSIKEFHNLVLRTGDVPLEVLGQQVDAWIASSRQ